MALNTEENILFKNSLIRQWRSQQKHVPTIVRPSKEMLHFAATAIASELTSSELEKNNFSNMNYAAMLKGLHSPGNTLHSLPS